MTALPSLMMPKASIHVLQGKTIHEPEVQFMCEAQFMPQADEIGITPQD